MDNDKYYVAIIDDSIVVIPHDITDIVGSFQISLRGESPEGRVLTSTSVTLTAVEAMNV